MAVECNGGMNADRNCVGLTGVCSQFSFSRDVSRLWQPKLQSKVYNRLILTQMVSLSYGRYAVQSAFAPSHKSKKIKIKTCWQFGHHTACKT